MTARRAGCWLIVSAFAAAVGHLAWHTLIGPPLSPSHMLKDDGPLLAAVDSDAPQLYLRHPLYLAQRPVRAWVQLLARDELHLVVNGRHIQSIEQPGFAVAVVADITPHLRSGHNVIAVAARQASLRHPPAVAVRGQYFLSDGAHEIGPGDQWRCQTIFEQKARWWYEPDFDDRHWAAARRADGTLTARLRYPSGAATSPTVGRYVTAAAVGTSGAAFRREFDVPARPRSVWLRLTTAASYRLAVNGQVCDDRETFRTDAPPPQPVRRVYDITPLVQAGANSVAVALAGSPEHLGVLADLEVEDQDGNRQRLGTDARWLTCPRPACDWLEPTDRIGWQPAHAEGRALGIQPWDAQPEVATLTLPASLQWRWRLGQFGVILAVGVVTRAICRLAEHVLARRFGVTGPQPLGAVYLALVLPTLALAGSVLASYDPRVALEDVYRPLWLTIALLAVPLQWALVEALACMPLPTAWARMRAFRPALASLGMAAALASLLVAGLFLRLRDIDTEELTGDEIIIGSLVDGVQATGFPSKQERLNTPVMYSNTSELATVFTAFAGFVFRDPVYVIRAPAIGWGLLTIALLFVAGRQLFRSPAVGLVAATIYTFAPVCVAMSNLGRYFCNLQFFTLLTVYLYWRTVRGHGPIDRRALWLTALAFIAAFLSWEGGALIVPGLIVGGLMLRRGRLGTILGERPVWFAMLMVGLVVGVQYGHRFLQQTQFLWYGVSASDVSLQPMWKYALFRPAFYIWQSSWNSDTLLPMLALAGSGVLALAHPWRTPVRFLLVVYLVTCLVTAALLTIVAWRYIFHLAPLLILLAAAAVVAAARKVRALARQPGVPAAWPAYGRGVALLLTAAFVVLGSGLTVRLIEVPAWRSSGYDLDTFKFHHLKGPSAFVRDRVQDGDIVIASNPTVVNFFIGRRRTDVWAESTLYLPATIDDARSAPLDRRNETPMVSNLEGLQRLFDRHPRVWYVGSPTVNNMLNTSEVSDFLRQHMEIVHEDVGSVVLFRNANHRPAELRGRDEAASRPAKLNPLP